MTNLKSTPFAAAWMLTTVLAARAGYAQTAPIAATGDDVVVQATRVAEPVRIDGRLDEAAYGAVVPSSGFLQQEPREGEPATEKTEVWVFFDEKNLYVSARCWDSRPDRMVASELRRDGSNASQGDNFVVVLDTFHDRRNGFYFQTNPSGVIREQSIVEEKSNVEWNTVWDVTAGRFEGGWTVEMAIPFKSLRYTEAGPQVWGINVRRQVKSRNETSYLTRVPAAYGVQGILKMAENAELRGVETPARSKNLEVKPYAISSLTSDRTVVPSFANKPKGDVGFDFKYGLTRGLIADATVNTDFAQIEEDVQQVNLTRFSLFFPEKRDFFLEGQGIFLFGNPLLVMGTLTPGDVPVMFFSRRIGLSQGQSVPVLGGGRVTGKVGRVSLGALNIETRDRPQAGAVATNFTAARMKMEVLRRSSVGLIATNRSPSPAGAGSNQLLGADAIMLFQKSLEVTGYYARSRTTGVTSQASYRGMLDYAGDRYGFVAEHLNVGPRFDPEVGFVQRMDFARSSMTGRFSPRTRRSTLIRKYTFQAGMDYITDASHTTTQNRQPKGLFQIDFQNSDIFRVNRQHDYERLPRPFTIARGVTVPAGAYEYDTTRVTYQLGQQRMLSGTVTGAAGSFYGGTRREISYNGRVAPAPLFNVEPGISLNWVDLPYGAFSVRQLNSRIIVTPSPTLLVSSLIQFNATNHALNSSVRLHWEYRSGSDLYVVYSDGRDTAALGFPDMLNRSFAVKVTRLVRF